MTSQENDFAGAALIEAPPGLPNLHLDVLLWYTLVFGELDLDHTPKTFAAIDVDLAAGEFIFKVIDVKVTIAVVEEAVLATTSI